MINILQAYLAQACGPSAHPYQPVQPPNNRSKVSKGVKAYPEGWRHVLNCAKDIVRAPILLKDSFPSPSQARIIVNEAFHEALATECTNGLVLEPGTSLSYKIVSGINLVWLFSKQDSRGLNR